MDLSESREIADCNHYRSGDVVATRMLSMTNLASSKSCGSAFSAATWPQPGVVVAILP